MAQYASLQGLKGRPCEDRFRLLDGNVPTVRVSDRGYVYAVMDGVGSAPKALRAAQHTADKLIGFFQRTDIPATASGLHALLRETNMEIRSWGLIDGTDRPLGATAATVAWFDPSGSLVLFQSGDTVAYRFNGRLTKLTREHSDGIGLTSWLGMGAQCHIEVETVPLEEGDLLCLVTDGVTKSMSDQHIEEVFREVRSERIANELARRARNRGSTDDITVVVVELEEW
jgi:serine/threonine protein phosphatase PrpC